MTASDKAALREARLAARLKANLARRKEQARDRAAKDEGAAARPSAAPCARDEEKGPSTS
jgi:hypothetical protein